VTGVLAGVTVVAIEQAVAAPLATRHLADLGARVIKVERPGPGDFARSYDQTVHGQASYFVWLNRGKESIALDLKDPAHAGVARQLIATADVLVQNLVPGAMARLGLDLAGLRRAHPRLITCSISGYGPDGPYRDRKAYDLLIQADAGLLEVTGTGPQRAKAGISVADIATGVYAFSSVLAALYARRASGQGSDLHIAMIDALGEWMSQPYYYSAYGGRPPERTGSRHATIAPYGPFRVAGNEEVFLAVQNDREWVRLCAEVLGQPALAADPRFADNPRRVAHTGELQAVIETALRGMTSAQARDRLEAAGIANTAVGSPAGLERHPQLVARRRWDRVATPGGPVRALRSPLLPDGGPEVAGEVPEVGQHTERILAELADGQGGPPEDGQAEVLSEVPALALAGVLGVPAPPPYAGGLALPLLWHWLYLLDRPAQHELGTDGHVRRELPPADELTARMFAGGRVRAHGPLVTGQLTTRTHSVVRDVVKEGLSGPLRFVTHRYRYEQGGRVLIEEERDIVYRKPARAPAQGGAAGAREVPREPGEVGRLELDTTSVLLFRFSALTYNAHRIHYDRDFARDTEGYPGLVVHGPLQAIAMAEAARGQMPADQPMTFEYRFAVPLFEDQGLIATATAGADGIATRVRDRTGRTTATGRLQPLEL
jgi:crotonobetainyl-CoA:carnitine CoA-transferase CaiB-like acyl-CoA transferase/hydroxyacyl-ACP dehydratase HTD2-like protein with hotdog domain